ncbi:bifunctional coenzyme A synthase-like [Actinia tenebrosa]|uniref:Bifunctional coenzyme A synthase n=1 Tax=Actinia tenebrosa TaxID=6105 RepID=A0A6P8GZD0_ACTTE|nr:bifunctional coenzyme A synthase-like [Actinia tenebrosa]
MFRCGLLVINPSCIKASIPQIIKVASKDIRDVLYVDLFNSKAACLSTTYSLLLQVYGRSHRSLGNVDIKVLLPELGQPKPRVLSKQPDITLVVDFPESSEEDNTLDNIKTWINERFWGLSEVQSRIVHLNKDLSLLSSESSIDLASIPSLKVYDEVALGGTFDRIHDGHRLLLGVACLLCERKITVGLSDGPLLERKVLKELIQSFEERKRIVEELIEDIRPGLQHNIVPLTDPIGPAGTDPNLKCLIVSKETEKGIAFVNEARRKSSLQDLEAHVIDIVTEETAMFTPGKSDDAEKMSSTIERHKLLGKLLRPVKSIPRKRSSERPYIIGLTGGIASGKSAISKRLEKLGAAVINCDLLGHLAYAPGKKAYGQIVESFGEEVLANDGTINRKALGTIVFADKDKLSELNKIVWPEIMNLVEEKISIFASQGAQVCVVEAAVLLEAGWDSVVDEIWVTFVPEGEAINRMLSRDKMNEQQAINRVRAQMSNEDRVSHAHVALSSLWEPEYTQKQVERAWKGLQERITALPSNQSAL